MMSHQTLVARWLLGSLNHPVDLTDPDVTTRVAAAANEVVSRKRPGPHVCTWESLGRSRKNDNTSWALEKVLNNPDHEYSSADLDAMADVLVRGGHMEPDAADAATAIRRAAKAAKDAAAAAVAAVAAAAEPEPEPESESNLQADLGYRPGWTKSPWAQLKKREAQYAAGIKGDACVESWHILALALLRDKVTNTKNGGSAYMSITILATLLGRNSQRVRKALGQGGAIAPYANGRGRNITVSAVTGGFSKLPSWMVDDALSDPGPGVPAKDPTKRPLLSGRTLTELAILVVVTLQRRGDFVWDGDTHTVDGVSGEDFAELAGVSRRLWLYGLKEANRRVWATSEGAGGWSVKARHVVHIVPLPDQRLQASTATESEETPAPEQNLESAGVEDASTQGASVTPLKVKKPTHPHYPAAQLIMNPWWAEFKGTQILPYSRILKTLLLALERGTHPDVVKAAMKILGDDHMPVTPGTLQMAISQRDKLLASGKNRPVNYVPMDMTDASSYPTNFE